MSTNESSNEGVQSCPKSNKLILVAKFVRDNPILLNKRKTPSVVSKKEQALSLLKKEIEANFRVTAEPKKLLKQINNLKSVVKKKTNVYVTGKESKKLSPAEKIMHEAMRGGSDSRSNPARHNLPGKTVVGVNLSGMPKEDSKELPLLLPASQTPEAKKIKYLPTEQYETNETRHLTTTELQRLVLLEHLQLIKLKKEKIIREMENN